MARRRGAPSHNSLSPPDSGVPSASSSTGFLNFPRSASPSSGLTQFLSKPTKWFNRSSSTGNVAGRSSTSSIEPRPSTSSSGRKPKISHPTDPRPIVDNLHPDSGLTGASRSVLDLSLARTATTFDHHHGGHPPHTPHTPRTPSSPSHPVFSKGLGDLRNISRKPWSKSADDLGKLSHANGPPLSPIDTAFQGKIEQYRNNRNDSVSSSNLPSPSTSPAASVHKGYPFPTAVATDTLSSSPPQMLGVLTTGSSPASTGTSPVTPNSGHVHSRSHSFTPRLPSKLSAPKLAGLAPASPKRKGSSSSEMELNKERPSRGEEKERNGSTGSLGAGPAPRPGFPFSFVNGSGSSKSLSPLNTDTGPSSGDKPSPSSTLLAPPTIIEPGCDDDLKHEKRTSQVIYHTGLINRMADFSPTLMNARANISYMTGSNAPTLSKGWKPFKLVMKGSKLYFYKPPSDRSNAIKELFPTELVVVLEEEGVAEEPEPVEGEGEDLHILRTKERDDGRRRRAYWGRGTHPSLVYSKGVERGTFEALVHESVFATTFHQPLFVADSPENHEGRAPSRYRPDWHQFSATILLTLPLLVGRTQFETEFFRCCALLLDGAADDCKEEEKARVHSLANQYLSYFDGPADVGAWEQWRQNTVPDFPAYTPTSSKTAGFPQSSSTQALYAPSPNLTPSPRKPGAEFSPNVGTFSPRPDGNDRMASLMDALSDTRSIRSPSSAKLVKPWRIVLDRNGLTRDVLLSIDAHLIARSLYVFHQQQMQHLPENVTADCWFELESEEPTSDGQPHSAVSLGSGTAQTPPAILKPFFGSEDHPHWLTKAVLLQILISDSSTRSNNNNAGSLGYGAEERLASQTSRTHSRSEVISAWAKVGEVCRRTGDECSWRAIFAALCSRPIARLEKVWKRVDGDGLRAVHSWTHPSHGETADIELKAIPWAGDRLVSFKEALDAARVGEGNEWDVASLTRGRINFEALRTDISLCSKKLDIPDGGESEDVLALVAHWRSSCDGGNTAVPMAYKLNRVDQFMSLSLAAEPRRKGSFEPYFWARSSPSSLFHPLTPLLFPEPLPAVAFLNRSLLARSRSESGASTNARDVQYLRELAALSTGNRRVLLDSVKMGGLDLGGTVIVLYDGELSLLVQAGVETIPPSQPSSRAPSRPPSSHGHSSVGSPEKALSRNPSMRVKAGSSQGLERKASQLRRNSLPSLSRKPSFITEDVTASDRPLRVVVQAGTLDRLVDILVEGLHGVSVSVADDNGEMPLSHGRTRDLRVDNDEYASVWWNTFRSFVTPNVFFELLRKRYLGAPAKAQSLPNGDLSVAIRIRSEIFDVMNKWIHSGGGSQDALDDSQLYSSILSFLTHEPDHVLPDLDGDLDEVASGTTLLNDLRKALLASFKAETQRPSQPRNTPSSDRSSRRTSAPTYGPHPPDIDDVSAEDLVSNLDAMASAAFRNVTQEDLFVTADILEVQSADRTGWFPVREPSSISDEVEIQCIHSYVHEVEPSPMISELGQDSLYRLLPPAVRGCTRAFAILRKWLVSKLVGVKVGFRARQKRMDLLLMAIEVCRLRNAETGSPELLPSERPCIRSFVEAILCAAVLSVESRLYHRAWQLVANARATTCESLGSMLGRSSITLLKNMESLTIDMGWVLEKMLEVISMPDVLDSNAQQDGLSLVNFDKRRSLNGLITSVVSNTGHGKPHRMDICRQDFERLNHIEQELNHVRFDLRTIREEAYREATVVPAPLGKRSPRPFQVLIILQQEKNKRDRALRDRLSKEKRQEQHRQDKQSEHLSKAMHTRRPPLSTPKSHRNKKSMSSAFLHFMRPISSAFTSETASSNAPKRTAAELDFSPSHKPVLVLNVADARVSQFINNERSFTFQVDTEDGGHYLLQALSKQEMKKWMDTIDRIAKSAAKRRLTYLGNTSKVQLQEHLLTPGVASRDPRAVFGIDLEFLLEREGGGQVQPGAIPSVINKLILEVESRGLTEVGIYRVAGAHTEVNSLRDALNRGEWPIDRFTDINAVCDLIKSWFRVLPGGMFPAASYTEILDISAQDQLDLQAKVINVRRVVRKLPDTHFPLLKRLMEHLDKVTDFEEQNQMTSDSLSTVFSPNLLRSSNNDIGFFFANMSSAHRAVKMLITHYHTIFDDAEQDLDAEQGPESEGEEYEQFDEPIPEEDEEEEEILSAGHESPEDEDDEDQTTHVRAASNAVAPVLDVNFPADTWISIPS